MSLTTTSATATPAIKTWRNPEEEQVIFSTVSRDTFLNGIFPNLNPSDLNSIATTCQQFQGMISDPDVRKLAGTIAMKSLFGPDAESDDPWGEVDRFYKHIYKTMKAGNVCDVQLNQTIGSLVKKKTHTIKDLSLSLAPTIEEAINIRNYLYAFNIFTYGKTNTEQGASLSKPLEIIEHVKQLKDHNFYTEPPPYYSVNKNFNPTFLTKTLLAPYDCLLFSNLNFSTDSFFINPVKIYNITMIKFEHINFENCYFHELAKCAKLRSLALHECKMNPNLGKKIGQLKHCSDLFSLDLTKCGLKSVPDELGAITSLTMIFLPKNLFSTTPSSLLTLPRLSIVNLKKNNISKLPEQFFTSPNIKEIDLKENKIEELPETYLEQLPHLDVSKNPLSDTTRFKIWCVEHPTLTKVMSVTVIALWGSLPWLL